MIDAARRKGLRSVVLELRTLLEGHRAPGGRWEPGDLEQQLGELGVGREGQPQSGSALGALRAEQRRARAVLEASLRERAAGGLSPQAAVSGLVGEAAYGWANRLLALRCLEARGLIDEVIVQREAYAGRSLEHHRVGRRSPDRCQGEDDGLTAVLLEAFAAQARRLPRVFDPAEPALALRPSAPVLRRCVGLLGGTLLTRTGERLDAAAPASPDALGWAYQYWNADERAAVLEALRTDRGAKIEGARLVAATQLYTEPYMVQFLVQNALGGRWLAMVPDSPLAERWPLLVREVDRPRLAPKPLDELRVIDPACGSGHFLTAAFDLLYDMHHEQAPGRDPVEICRIILERNLCGIDLDARAVQLAEAALWMKAAERGVELSQARPRLVAASRELGSLWRPDPAPVGAERELGALLGERYDVVLCNPPYVDKRDYGASLRSVLRSDYPAGAGNTFAAFVLRCLELSRGTVGMVTPQTFLFLRSYQALRRRMSETAAVELLVRLGVGAFRDAAVDAAMFVLRLEPDDACREQSSGVYFDLASARDKAAELEATLRLAPTERARRSFRRTLGELGALPGSPFAFAAGPGTLRCFRELPPLSTRADVVLGMKTSDNRRFVRLWWELEGSAAELRALGWVPYDKQASGQRYAAGSSHWVRWHGPSIALYRHARTAQLPNERYWFRPGIVYGLVSKDFAAKLLPPGHMSDMAASCVFPRRAEDTAALLGLLNCRIGQYWLRLLNPTVNFQPGDVQRLPVPLLDGASAARLQDAVARAVSASGALRRAMPTDRGFEPDPLAAGDVRSALRAGLGARRERRRELELARDEIDRLAGELYALPPDELGQVAAELGEGHRTGDLPSDAGEQRLAADLVTVLVLRCFGHRWPSEVERGLVSQAPIAVDGIVAPADGADLQPLLTLVRARLRNESGVARASETERELGELLGKPLGDWLEQELFAHHIKQFRRRPLLWQLAGARRGARGRPALACWLYVHRLDGDTLPKLRSHYLGPLGGALRRELGAMPAGELPARRALEQRVGELEQLDRGLERVVTGGFGCSALGSELADEPLDCWCARESSLPPPASRSEHEANEARYLPNRHDGIRVNLAPLELARVLAADVLGRPDAERALHERAAWRLAERQWCRQGALGQPSWWSEPATSR